MNTLERLDYCRTPTKRIGRSTGLARITGKYRLPWHDSIIVASALEGRCDMLYSEDFQHGRKIEGLRIENPFA